MEALQQIRLAIKILEDRRPSTPGLGAPINLLRTAVFELEQQLYPVKPQFDYNDGNPDPEWVKPQFDYEDGNPDPE